MPSGQGPKSTMESGSNPILDANMRALARTSPGAVTAIAGSTPRAGMAWTCARGADGESVAVATLDEVILSGPAAGRVVPRALCSQRDPLGEARDLTRDVKVAQNPVVVVIGFGVGHHVAELCTRMGRSGLVVVLETDVPLLRSVMERVDCTRWLNAGNLLLFTDPADEGAMAQALLGLDPMLAMGVQIVDHPPSLPRIGAARGEFVDRFTALVRAVRMNVVTTMVQTEATLRNLTQNLDHYALGLGVQGWQGLARGKPALLIAAGPSLAPALDLLAARPHLRDEFVVIAVQTVLKTLLARGIKPHIVTALDYHEISGRFYEGLKASDVEGVTLVVEPKVNPVVPASWPGPRSSVRCTGDLFLDELLGPLARPMGRIQPGATVAHLNYYLARFLGCDPVILVGQDLGFSDGQYYSDRAAIHDTWACELSEVRTLEMFEWERIVRMRPQLTRVTDTLGRSIYTDEQMHTYLVGFQRAFKEDAARGLTTLDASGAGVRKQHAEPVDLAAALGQYASRGVETLGWAASAGAGAGGSGDAGKIEAARGEALAERVRTIARDARTIAARSRETRDLLERMLTLQHDQKRVGELIARVERLRDEVVALQPAFGLIERLNQTGAFNRHRADRAIYIESDLDALGVQKAQIERDITNVRWVGDAGEALARLLDDALTALRGGARVTRDPLPEPSPTGDLPGRRHRVWGLVSLRPGFAGLGQRREHAHGVQCLRGVIARLRRCEELEGVCVLSEEPERLAREVFGTSPVPAPVRFMKARWRGLSQGLLRSGRALAPHCWRGGLAGLTVYDEALDAWSMHRACADLNADAALVVGDDWTLFDPALSDALIARYRESPTGHRLTFSQAAPGLAGCVLATSLLHDLARSRERAGVHASIGGVLSYYPTVPTPDPIAKSSCVRVAPAVRDALVRVIPDLPGRTLWIGHALMRANIDPTTASAEDIARALDEHARVAGDPPAPGTAMIDATGLRAAFTGSLPTLDQTAVTVHAGRAPLEAIESLMDALRTRARAGWIHLRVDLDRTPDEVLALFAQGVDVLSVDLHGASAATFSAVTGRDGEAFTRTQDNLALLLKLRLRSEPCGDEEGPGALGGFTPWVVPRLARCDAVMEEIDGWYDQWVRVCGHAIIDPPTAAATLRGRGRIKAFTAPALAGRRRALDHAVLILDGAGVSALASTEAGT